MTDLLLSSELNPQQRGFAETIRASGETLLTIINDILDFSKIEAGKLTFEILDFNLIETVESTLGFWRLPPTAKGSNLPISTPGKALFSKGASHDTFHRRMTGDTGPKKVQSRSSASVMARIKYGATVFR